MVRFLSIPPYAGYLACVFLAAAIAGTGCTNQAKVSEEKANHWAVAVAGRATEDVKEVERGLPVGAVQIASLWAQGADPSKDLPAVRRGLTRVRAEVPDLTRASSTFFALTDARGVAIRNDLEQDVMAGQDVWRLFPDLEKARTGGVATSAGLFVGARAPGGPDRDWVAAAAVKGDHGEFAGMLLTGWPFRRFAFHLQEWLRHDLIEEQAKTKDPGKLPIVYVSVFDGTGVYSAPLTPSVNEAALVQLGLVGKTVQGPVHGVLPITGRDFGFAAVRVPDLEPEAGVVVLWSEI
jgi:hypothetical protein